MALLLAISRMKRKKMANYGLEIAFWVILGVYLLKLSGLLKKWRKCLKWYTHRYGNSRTPIGYVPVRYARSINAPACPTRVQLAPLAPTTPVIPVVLGQCSTVQKTARQWWASAASGQLNRAGAYARGYLERASLAICCQLETQWDRAVIRTKYYVIIHCYKVLRWFVMVANSDYNGVM